MTPEPTLTDAQSKAYLFELLKNNAGCKLPCWWGIKPGVTSWEEARRLISFMGARTDDALSESGPVLHGTAGYDWLPYMSNRIGFYDDGGIVQAFVISSVGYEDKSFFRELWKSYSPEQILANYGQPTNVFAGASPGGGEISTPGAGLILKYDDRFLVIYSIKPLVIDDLDVPVYRICPSWQDVTWGSKLDMYIKSENYAMTIDDFIKSISSDDLTTVKPIVEVAGISVEEFYQRFQPDHGPACFDTPQEMWK